MKTLEDFKNEVAQSKGFEDWERYLLQTINKFYFLGSLEKASILYAKYIQEETIKRCAESARMQTTCYDSTCSGCAEGCAMPVTKIYKQSILNIDRILK